MRDQVLRAIVLTVIVTNLLDAAGMVVLPVYARRIFDDAASLGLMLGAAAAGSVIGALAFARAGHRISRRTVYTYGFVVTTLWYPVLALFPPLAIAVVAKLISGIGSGPLNPVIDTVAYLRIPEDKRGCVFGVLTAIAWIAMPLGALTGGVLVEAIGLRPSLLVIGGAYLLTTLSMRVTRGITQLDEQPPSDIAETELSTA